MTPPKHQGDKPKELPTSISPNNEATIITLPSPIPTRAEPRTSRSSREFYDSAGEDIDSAQPENLKRRRSDLGDLIVKPTAPAKPISTKPVELFRQAKRPEITRLAETDPMPPPPANK